MKIKSPAGIFFVLTVLSGGLPFVLYGWQRVFGDLPTAGDWLAQGTNHGPWRWQPEGFAIGYPVVLLAVITLTVFAVLALKRRSLSTVWQGLGLIALQAAALYGQVAALYWTID